MNYPMPGDEIVVDGVRCVVLSVASLDGSVLVDGPTGQKWVMPQGSDDPEI